MGSTVICVLFLAGCIDEHYGEDSNTIVTNLTGYAWERTFQIRTEDGRDAEVCEHYEFGLNGKASCKSRTTCDGEEVEEHVHYFRYDFITPNNRYLLLDYCYWQIDRISSSVLSIYETFENPVVVMGRPGNIRVSRLSRWGMTDALCLMCFRDRGVTGISEGKI